MQQEMEYVLRVYQEKSFSKAAESLYLTQPALSMAIRKVEETIGMPIFDRSVRPLGLTPAGEAYLDYIRGMIQLEQDMEQQMQDIREVNTGSVTLGGSHYINAYILPEVLSAFSTDYPNVRFNIVESSSAQLSQMLANREVDVTFNCNPRFMLDFERYPAFEDHILLAVPRSLHINDSLHPFALSAEAILRRKHLESDCPCVPLESFRKEEFILLNPGNNLFERAHQLFQEADFTPNIKLQLSQLVTAYHFADSALGVTFVSDRLVTTKQDNLYYYKLDSELTNRMFYMLLPKKKYTSHAIRTFVSFCTKRLGSH